MLTIVGATLRERQVIENLYHASLRGVLLDGKTPADPSTRDFVEMTLEYGKVFSPRPLPNYLKVVPNNRTLYSRCRWAAQLCLIHQGSLSYVEGFCYLGKDIFYHAWCVNDHGYVYDPAIDLNKVTSEKVYVGIEVGYNSLKDSLMNKRDYGIFYFYKEGKSGTTTNAGEANA